MMYTSSIYSFISLSLISICIFINSMNHLMIYLSMKNYFICPPKNSPLTQTGVKGKHTVHMICSWSCCPNRAAAVFSWCTFLKTVVKWHQHRMDTGWEAELCCVPRFGPAVAYLHKTWHVYWGFSEWFSKFHSQSLNTPSLHKHVTLRAVTQSEIAQQVFCLWQLMGAQSDITDVWPEMRRVF